MRFRLLIAAIVLIPSAAARADVPGFAFLEVPAGARAAALGGAYGALAEGVEAAFWNPAGLAGTHGSQLTAAHTEFFQQLRHDQFAVAGRMFGGVTSASVRAFYSQPIDERDELGNLIGSFGTHDLELALGYGRTATPGVRLGGTVQLVRERIADAATNTWAMNVGGTWEPPALRGARLSVSGHNLGPSAAYVIDGVKGAPVPLPAALQAGIAFGAPPAARGFALRGAVETRLARGRPAVGMVGAELAGLAGAALRAGVRINDPSASVSLGAGWTTGGLRLDYAWVPYKLDLGDTHRFGVTAQF
jgi:uncharacterized protein UPF0164